MVECDPCWFASFEVISGRNASAARLRDRHGERTKFQGVRGLADERIDRG
jgi:hypothetical protein